MRTWSEYSFIFHFTLMILFSLVPGEEKSRLMAAETIPYTIVQKDGPIEIRQYEPYSVAEMEITSLFEEAGSMAFRPLFRYISGKNSSQRKIAMTAPVTQEAAEKENRTPLTEAAVWKIGFVMPSHLSFETLPSPDDPAITIRRIPARRIAALRYSGTWSHERYSRFLEQLEIWIRKNGYRILDQPVFARYDPPFMPFFMRHNEILIPIEREATGEPGRQEH